MRYRILGKTGLRVSVIGLGTWQLGGEWGKDFTQSEVRAMFRRALELGINLIDTAECYGDHTSERLIGQAIAELGARKEFLIATKFGHKFTGHLKRDEPRSGADIQKQLEDSLKALQTDHIDLYQYHSVRESELNPEDVRATLDKAAAAGKILHIGNSVAASTKTTTQIEMSPELKVEAIQIVYNRLTRVPEEGMLPACERLNLGVLARVPLASGLLSGKYKPGATFPANDVRHGQSGEGLDAKLREVEAIAANEVPAGVSMAHWALAWCLKNPAVHCVIPGCKDVKQVESNAGAAALVAA